MAFSFDSISNADMTAFTHGTYRVDAALSVNPATGRNATPELTARHPGNRVVAILWIQGEDDLGAHTPVDQYTSCLADLVNAWRQRWGVPGEPPIPFLGAGFCPYLGGGPHNKIQLMYRQSAGQGRFIENFWGSPSLADQLEHGSKALGYADTSFKFDGDFDPLECDGAHVRFCLPGEAYTEESPAARTHARTDTAPAFPSRSITKKHTRSWGNDSLTRMQR